MLIVAIAVEGWQKNTAEFWRWAGGVYSLLGRRWRSASDWCHLQRRRRWGRRGSRGWLTCAKTCGSRAQTWKTTNIEDGCMARFLHIHIWRLSLIKWIQLLPMMDNVTYNDSEQTEEQYDTSGIDDGMQRLDTGSKILHITEILQWNISYALSTYFIVTVYNAPLCCVYSIYIMYIYVFIYMRTD